MACRVCTAYSKVCAKFRKVVLSQLRFLATNPKILNFTLFFKTEFRCMEPLQQAITIMISAAQLGFWQLQ